MSLTNDPTGGRWEKGERRRTQVIAASLVLNLFLSLGVIVTRAVDHSVLSRVRASEDASRQVGETAQCRAEVAFRHDQLLDQFLIAVVNRQPLENDFIVALKQSSDDLSAIKTLCPTGGNR